MNETGHPRSGGDRRPEMRVLSVLSRIGRRSGAALLVGVLTIGLLALRGAGGAAPTRVAVAPAPHQRLYLAANSPVPALYLVAPGARARRLSLLPPRAPLSLSASGSDLLLGMEHELAFSSDAGRSWRNTGVPGAHFLATALSGADGLAVAWGEALWYTHNGGVSWARGLVGAAYLQVNSVVIEPGGPWYAASELALLESLDGGATWTALKGLPDRLTALSEVGGAVFVGTWRGQVLASTSGFQSITKVPGGIWALNGGAWLATTSGLYQGDKLVGLGRSEFVALVRSGSMLYAVTAGGDRVWADTASGWRMVSTAS